VTRDSWPGFPRDPGHPRQHRTTGLKTSRSSCRGSIPLSTDAQANPIHDLTENQSLTTINSCEHSVGCDQRSESKTRCAGTGSRWNQHAFTWLKDLRAGTPQRAFRPLVTPYGRRLNAEQVSRPVRRRDRRSHFPAKPTVRRPAVRNAGRSGDHPTTAVIGWLAVEPWRAPRNPNHWGLAALDRQPPEASRSVSTKATKVVGWNKLRAVPAVVSQNALRLPELRGACSSLQTNSKLRSGGRRWPQETGNKASCFCVLLYFFVANPSRGNLFKIRAYDRNSRPFTVLVLLAKSPDSTPSLCSMLT
jgi:hypothetical protein